MKAIDHWWPYLIWTKEPSIIETDYKNLIYWKSPCNLTERIAQWHEKLQDYNFKIVHIQGKNNTPADALSWPNDDEQQTEERQIALIPPEVFMKLTNMDPTSLLKYQLGKRQQDHSKWIEDLKEEHWFWRRGTTWVDPKGQLVVPPDKLLKK